LLLTGCVAPAIQKTDDALKARIEQMEIGVSKIKTEAVVEAKKAASDLVKQASEDLQKTGEALIDKAADRVEKVVDDLRTRAVADIQKTLKEDVPAAASQAVVQSADKIMERLGVEKNTVPGKNGIPMEVWALGGTGLAGFLGTYGKSILRWFNRKKVEEKDEEWLDEQLAKRGIKPVKEA